MEVPGRRSAGLWLALSLLAGIAAAGAWAPRVEARESAAAPGGGPNTQQGAREVLAGVRARLEAGESFASDFEQINRWAAFSEPDTARGRLVLAPGARFRLDYTRPAGQRVGCDGEHVWTYLPEDRQVIRAALEETTGWGEFFVSGLAAPADSAGVAMSRPPWGAIVRLALTPRPEWSLSSLYVEIAHEARLPVGYGYRDQEGNAAEFVFLTPRFRASVADTLFRFGVPEGYELFEAR